MGMSFQEESKRIRKGQVKMRNMQQPTGDQPKGSSEHRKLIKPRNREMRTTPDREMAEGDFEVVCCYLLFPVMIQEAEVLVLVHDHAGRIS